ncbi:N-acetylglucosaminyl-diphospho-decaprenol L-rhamnosyltransferase [bacterium HR09]|nr:N-acetylglucosaminyl-diphospho-decaprenol L-rhamnosyltransferase [bacterium HR09]
MARVGVVIVHYGDAEPTRRCLRSVWEDPSPVDRRVVVVDNSRNLPALDGADVLQFSDNPGFGEGVNRGARFLGGDSGHVLVALNHDVELLPGFLEAAVRNLERPKVGAVGGPLFFPDGRSLWSAGGAVLWPLGVVMQYRSLARAWRSRPVGFLPGAALAFRWEAFSRVGGFDPRYFMYHEDLDLCLRLRRAGWKLWYSPAVAAVHHLGSATGSHVFSPFYLEHMTKTRLRPFRPFAFRLWLALVHSLYVAFRSLGFSLRGQREQALALWRGHWAALVSLPQGPLPVS